MNKFLVCSLAVCLLGSGCTSSGDPREGGLFDYWATGEEGYNERLEKKREEIRREQEAAEAARSGTADLEARKQALAAKIAEQNKQLAALDKKIADMEEDLRKLTGLSAQKTAQRDALMAELAGLQSQIRAMQGNTAEETAAREAKIAKLKAQAEEADKELELLVEI